jgi:hypothetical protein
MEANKLGLRHVVDMQYRLPVAGLSNGVLRVLDRIGLLSATAPSAEELVESALGDRAHELAPSVVRSLREYIADLDEAGSPTALGHFMLAHQLQLIVSQRHALDQTCAANPDIAAQPIEKPIFIVGQPRTGSTLLHYLFDSGGAMRAPHSWELLAPSPSANGQTDDRDQSKIRAARREEVMVRLLAPRLFLMHPMEALMPQECSFMLRLDMFGTFLTIPAHVPTFESRSRTPERIRSAYRVHRRTLQVLQWKASGRWVLKLPAHLQNLDYLLAEYPDATIIWTHRDPADCIPSLAQLFAEARRLVYGQPDLHAIGKSVLARSSAGITTAMDTAETLKAKYPDAKLINMGFESFAADPVQEMRGMYSQLGLDWTPEVDVAISGRLANNARPPARLRRYDATDFGLTQQDIGDELSEYISRYAEYLH